MKTLKQLQNDLLVIRKDLEPLQIAYYEADTEDQEELLECQLQVIEAKREKAEKELKDNCYIELKRTGMLSNDIKDLFIKSEKNAIIESKLIDLLLKM